jgi:hypothetical protein
MARIEEGRCRPRSRGKGVKGAFPSSACSRTRRARKSPHRQDAAPLTSCLDLDSLGSTR